MADDRKYLGQNVNLQPDEIRWDRTNGYQLHRTWLGNPVALALDSNIVKQFAESFVLAADGPLGIMAARYANQVGDASADAVESLYEIEGEETTKSIFLHPNFSKIPPHAVAGIRNIVETGDGKTDAEIVTALSEYTIGQPQAVVDAVLNAYRLLAKGDPDYLVITYVVSRNRIISRFFTSLDMLYADDGKIFSSPQLSAAIGDPALFSFPVKSANIEQDSGLLLADGFRKRPTRVQALSNGKYAVHESWHSGSWTTLTYQLK